QGAARMMSLAPPERIAWPGCPATRKRKPAIPQQGWDFQPASASMPPGRMLQNLAGDQLSEPAVSVRSKGILKDLDPSELIDESRVKAHRGQQPRRKTAAIFQRRIADAPDVPRADPLCRAVVALRFLDLDKGIFVV